MSLLRKLHHVLSPLIYRDGTAVVPPHVAAEWAERQFLRRLLRDRQVDCVIDVGANVGQYATLLRLIGFTGTILSFEPSPDTFEELVKASASDSKWHAFQCALGSKASTATLNRMKLSVFNSFREPSTRDTKMAEPYNQIVDTVEVQVERLDEVFPRLRDRFNIERPFLKTDTQGFDLEVFDGASGIHSELAGVQCELAVQRLYEGVAPWTEALNVYGNAGFELAGIFSVLPRESVLVECDCFFSRKRVL